MLERRSSLWFVLAIAGQVIGQSSGANGTDLTDVNNWPACSFKCVPLGFGPPANCGSLANRTCICTRPEFVLAIAECEQVGCSPEEKEQIATFSNELCAPVGGLGTAVNSAFSTFYSAYTATATATSTPVLVAPTPAPPVAGNASDLRSYPICAQQCFNETVSQMSISGDDLANLNILCGPQLRAATSACEAVSCSPLDYQKMTQLAQELCGPRYTNNTSLSATVAAAIESATASAEQALASTGFTSSSNASVTAVATGTPTPSAFTGGASGGSVWTTGMMTGFLLLGALGIVVLGVW